MHPIERDQTDQNERQALNQASVRVAAARFEANHSAAASEFPQQELRLLPAQRYFSTALSELALLFDAEREHAAGLVKMNQECIKDRDQARMDERSAARQLDKAVSLAAEAFHYQNRLPADLVQRLSRFLASLPKQSAQQQAQPTEEQARLQQLAGMTVDPVRVLEGWRKAHAARGIAAEHFVQVEDKQREADNPLLSFDATVWAREFMRVHYGKSIATDGGFDEGDALAWFADALMRGFDEHAWQTQAQARVAELEREQREDTVHRSNALAHVRRLENENIELHAALEKLRTKNEKALNILLTATTGKRVGLAVEALQ